jgi:Ca2+-binding EF-hand superfamily protein
MMDYFFAWKVREFEIEYLLPAKIYFPYLSKTDVSTCLQVFRKFDEDESGTIDSRELGKALTYMGQGCNEQTLKTLLDKYSSSRDGTLSWVDFLEVI